MRFKPKSWFSVAGILVLIGLLFFLLRILIYFLKWHFEQPIHP